MNPITAKVRYLLPGTEKPVYFASRGGADALVFDHTLRSIHTAFTNPLATPDAPARESMESRLLVFFN